MKYSLDDLLQMNVSWQKTDFLFFWGHANRTEKLAKSCLSQWYPASFIVDGVYYNCAEQYMMAEKARLFGDEEDFVPDRSVTKGVPPSRCTEG